MINEYTISKGTKISYTTFAIVLLGLSIFLFYKYNPEVTSWVLLIPTLLLISAVLIVVSNMKRKVIIDDDSIISISLFSKKEIAIQSVKGCRIYPKGLYIESVLPCDKTIQINYPDYTQGEELGKWLKDNFQDLNAIDLEKGEHVVLQDIKLGITETERTEKLKNAKGKALVYNIIGPFISFILIFISDRIPKISTVFLLCYPLLGLIILVTSKGLIKFITNRQRSVFPSIMLGMALPSFVLLITSMSYDLLTTRNVWLPVAIISGSFLFILYWGGINKTTASLKEQIICIVITVPIYSFGSTISVNCIFDNHRIQTFSEKVLYKRYAQGKHTTYYLTLTAWPGESEVREVTVSSDVYNNIAVKDTVNINLHKGILRVPWFTITRK
ncbi:MAG: hypothetical protein P4L41_07315 [Flavipsychrobacter sp.]|nr:hypothetical protein [Flavipsychrobacter sp.]